MIAVVHSNIQESVISRMAQERLELRQAIEAVKHSFRTGTECILSQEMLDKLVKLGYI